MTPAENIYRSDADMVDGLVDVEGYDDGNYIEDDQYDDGQPDMMQNVMTCTDTGQNGIAITTVLNIRKIGDRMGILFVAILIGIVIYGYQKNEILL